MKILNFFSGLATVFCVVSCSSDKVTEKSGEDEEAKKLFQGVWVDDDTEEAIFQAKGDSIFYPDGSVAPVYFEIVGDTLVFKGGTETHYKIDKRTENVMWLHSLNDDVLKLHKSDSEDDIAQFKSSSYSPKIYTEITKRDTVLNYNKERYHCYVAVNPTRRKVVCTSYSAEGLSVDNIYYDNVINICVYHGTQCLYKKDIHKEDFGKMIPPQFIKSAILSDVVFAGIDAKGCKFDATICAPEGSSCYMVEITVGFDGKSSSELLEY